MLLHSVPTRWLFPRLAALVALCWSLGAATAARLPVEFSIRRWTATERLPLSSVEAMVQTRDGFIWFAMNGGLGRFDGENLRVFDAANTPELTVPVITALAEAPDGSLWIGSAGGGLVRWDAGRFQRFGPADGLLNEQVKALSLGRDGRLWIGTDGGGVFVRSPEGRVRNYGPAEGLEDPYVIGLKMDVSGKLIVATAAGGRGLTRERALEGCNRSGAAPPRPEVGVPPSRKESEVTGRLPGGATCGRRNLPKRSTAMLRPKYFLGSRPITLSRHDLLPYQRCDHAGRVRVAHRSQHGGAQSDE
jgi:hypothetical protein